MKPTVNVGGKAPEAKQELAAQAGPTVRIAPVTPPAIAPPPPQPAPAGPTVRVQPTAPQRPVEAEPTAPPARIGPTVSIKPSLPPPPGIPVPQPPTPPPPARPTGPTVMASGKKRERIPVTDDDVFMRNPHLPEETRSRTIALIDSINVDVANDREAILWGTQVQKRYAELVNESLNLSQSALLTQVEGHAKRMIEILNAINLKRVCGLEPTRFLDAFRRTTKTIDTPEELEAARIELGQLVGHLNARVDPLLVLKEEMERIGKEVEAVELEAMAHAEASGFVVDHLNGLNDPSKMTLAQRFLERSGSLTATVSQIRQDKAIRAMQVEHPVKLIEAVQQVTLVTLPSWLSTLTNILAMFQGRGRKPNLTEIDELGDVAKKLIETLSV